MTVRTLGPGSLKIGAAGSPKEFAADCTKATLTPSTKSDDPIPLLNGSELSSEDETTWELGGAVVDSFEAESLQNWAIQHAGQELPFVWTPNNAAASSYSGTVKVRPIALGGDVKKKNTNDFGFPLIGAPTVGTV